MWAATPRNAAPASCISTASPPNPARCWRLQCEGAKITTIEGLAEPNGPLHPMQEAFRQNHGLQCGYCTPGMIMAALDIVRRNGNDLDEHTIREQLDGNICRCTGYHNIVKAIAAGAKAMAKGGAVAASRGISIAKIRSVLKKQTREEDRYERDRNRRLGAPQGRLPFHYRARPIYRRRGAAGRDPRRVRALAACPRQNQKHRRQRGQENAGRGRCAHRRANLPPTRSAISSAAG